MRDKIPKKNRRLSGGDILGRMYRGTTYRGTGTKSEMYRGTSRVSRVLIAGQEYYEEVGWVGEILATGEFIIDPPPLHSFFSPPRKVGTTKVGTRLKCGMKVGTSGKILGIWRDIVPFSPKQAGQVRSGRDKISNKGRDIPPVPTLKVGTKKL